MNEEPRLAALYIRVSTEEQVDGFSLDAQRAALLDYCRKKSLDVYKVYVDAGISGKSIEGRPALRELLGDAENGRFQHAACLRLNRLSRKLADLLRIVEVFDRHSIALHSLTEGLQTDNPVGKLGLHMAGSVAQFEREQIAQNVRLGMQRRSRLGKWNSGNQVLGYRWVAHPVDPRFSHVEIVSEEADRVIAMFEWYASGFGLKTIANRLNFAGHPTKRGKVFHSVSVRGILTNVNYIGKITYADDKGKRIVTDGDHEPIVTLELWDRVQQQLSERSYPPTKKIQRHLLLSGLLKCPTCGSSMIPNHVTRHRKNGTSRINHYYVCSRYNSGGRSLCQPNHIQANEAESWVSDQVRYFFSHPSVAERLVNEIHARRDKKLLPVRQEIKRIDTLLASIKERSIRCYEMFEDGHIDAPELRKRLDAIRTESSLLEEDRGQLERKIETHPEQSIPASTIRQALDSFRPMFRSASPEQQGKLLRSVIDRIVIPPNRDMTQAVIQGTAALMGLRIPSIPAKEEL